MLYVHAFCGRGDGEKGKYNSAYPWQHNIAGQTLLVDKENGMPTRHIPLSLETAKKKQVSVTF